MALEERDQNRWVVDLGGGDTFVAERTAAGLTAMSMPARRQAVVDRATVEQVRRALDEAIQAGQS